MIMLRDLFLDAMESNGYGVLSAIEAWNTIYQPEINALSAGKYMYFIGAHEITFIKA